MDYLKLGAAVFLALHGLVHLWYVVLSQGWVTVEEQMGWTGHSWLLSGTLSADAVLTLATAVYVAVTLGFVAGGVGFYLGSDWAGPVLVGTAVLSTLMLVAMWNGEVELLVEQGLLGVLINAGVAYFFLVR